MYKVLVIQTASIGDVILATPLLEGIHTRMPSASIDIMVKKGMEGLFAGHPFLNRVLVLDKKRKFRSAFSLLKGIRSTRYDAVINIQRFALTGVITAFSGADKRIGFGKNPLSPLFTRAIRHLIGKGIHEVDRNLSLLGSLVESEDAGQKAISRRPVLYPSERDLKGTERYRNSNYVTVSPASLWFTKQWPAAKWAGLCERMPQGTRVYLLGSAADRNLCREIMNSSSHNNVVDLSGKLSFLESAALMKNALMNYTNDSAPMHLASSVNAPVTVVYCSTVPGFGFGPLSEKSLIVETRQDLKCRPCGLHGHRECPEKHFRCAETIAPGDFPLPD